GELAHALEEAGRRDHVAVGALHGLEDDRGHRARRLALELLAQEGEGVRSAVVLALGPERAMARVGIGGEVKTGRRRAVAVLEPVVEQAHDAGGLAVEAAPEADDLELARL